MNWLALVELLLPLLEMVPKIVKAWDTAPKNGVAAVKAVVDQNPQLVPALTNIGAVMFPKLSPELHAAAAALTVSHPNNTSWVQSSLNLLESTGYISFGAPLAVDGIYGKHTTAAVEALQVKLGMAVHGFVGDAEYNAIAGLLAKL